MVPELNAYHWIVLNSSAGKDSQAMLDYVVAECDRACVLRDRLVVAHADLGRVEWAGTRELAEKQAQHYGLAFVAISRPQGDLLDHISKRGKFPSPAARFCTSDHLCGAPHKWSYVATVIMWRRADFLGPSVGLPRQDAT